MKSQLIFGSLLFLSMNTFKGIEQTRKDELESLEFVIIYLFNGSLPWSEIKFNTTLFTKYWNILIPLSLTR